MMNLIILLLIILKSNLTQKKILKKIIRAAGFITIDDLEVNEVRGIYSYFGDCKMYDYSLLEKKLNTLLSLLSGIFWIPSWTSGTRQQLMLVHLNAVRVGSRESGKGS